MNEKCNKDNKEIVDDDNNDEISEQEKDIIYETGENQNDNNENKETNKVAINYPLSYAIACNFSTKSEINERCISDVESLICDDENGKVKIYEVDHASGKKWSVIYGVNRSARDLISTFLSSLHVLSKIRRSSVIERYADIIEHIEAWFDKKGIDVSLRSVQGISSFSKLAITKEQTNEEQEKNNSSSRDYAISMYNRELLLVKRIKIFLTVLPILGFNSGGYDIPLIKPYLFDILVNDYNIPISEIKFIKKQS